MQHNTSISCGISLLFKKKKDSSVHKLFRICACIIYKSVASLKVWCREPKGAFSIEAMGSTEPIAFAHILYYAQKITKYDQIIKFLTH